MRIAVGQFASRQDKDLNRKVATGLVRDAAQAGAEIIVLPEASIYPLNRPPTELAKAAESLDGPFVAALTGAASAFGTTIIAGMFEEVPGERLVYNTVVAVDPTGVIGRYRKLHLYDALGLKESDSLLPGPIDGDELLVVTLGELVVGVATCYDLRFPEIFRALADKGVNTFAVPAAWVAGPLKKEHWTTMCRARAIENTSYLIAAAQPPPIYCGHSLVLDPMGVEVAKLGEATGLATAELSLERIHSVRTSLPVLTQRRYEVKPIF